MRKGSILSVFAVLGLVVFGIGLASLDQPFVVSEEKDPFNTNLGYGNQVCVYLNGDLLSCQKNLVVNNGLDMLREKLNGASTGAIEYLTLGNTTGPSAGTTSHPGEQDDCGLTGTAATSFDMAENGNRTLSATWTYTGCSGSRIVNSTGLYNGSGSGEYFAGVTFSDATLASDGDQLTVNWSQWFTEA